ncbi:SR-related and CTD-associated factor 4 [Plutella xylostella]|uniref:SR-related and CTD-associated factor 4 n=1 Tax=Plutella xylostella TaxID=51655 RepID=UPI0020325FFB|nr:SR-related and CTD-associated factor 4 [Plutella xylostella]
MDMSEVKAFNAELSGLYDNKPPISKAKMSAITRGAIKAIKFYKHVVHSVEKFIQKCKPEYKVPGLYVIDSIVRQSRHQFGQDKDVFAPRFAKNMQQTFANLFRCPPEDKRNIIRVLNLWQKNNVFGPDVIQPLMDMADPNHPLHQEIQQQQNANGSSMNISNSSDNRPSPGPAQHTPQGPSPVGAQFQDDSNPPPSGVKFNRKLLNDFEYDSEDEAEPPPQPPPQHTNPADALGSILTNPEIMRQLQSLQAQMQMMTGVPMQNVMPMQMDIQMQMQHQNVGLPFLSQPEMPKQQESKDDKAESDIEFVETGPQVIEIPDANDSSRSPSPSRRRRSRSPRRRRRGERSRSRSPRRRRDRERDRDREKEKEKDSAKTSKEREAERERQREREKKGLPPIKKENLSVCSTTLWVGHLSKLATQEELSDMFGAHGGVVSIDVVAPRGCAFVVMERRRDAYKARHKLDKHKLHSKEITVAWAPGKGVKGREWKDYWEVEHGVSYLPWARLQQLWRLGALSMDALEDGGSVDEETLPPWLPPRILPKVMDGQMGLLGAMPPALPGAAGALPPGLSAANIPLPGGVPPQTSMAAVPPMTMPPGMPPGLAPGMPPGIRPPSIPGRVGLQATSAGLPPTGPLLGFPPGMPPTSMPPTPGMGGMPGFLGGLMGLGGMMPFGMAHHTPPPALPQQQSETTHTDDAMDLDTEDQGDTPEKGDGGISLPEQLQALLSKPPPIFNSSEPPPPFNASEPPPSFNNMSIPPPETDKDDDKKGERDRDRDRRDRRDRGDRDRRDRGDRDRRDRERDRGGRDRDRDDGRRDRDRERGRDRRDRDGARGERDRETRFSNRDNNTDKPRDKSPRAATEGGAPEKTLQERLWEMANGKPANQQRDDDKPDQSQPSFDAVQDDAVDMDARHDGGRHNMDMMGRRPPSLLGDAPDMSKQDDSGWTQLPPPRPAPPHMPPNFRAELRLRGPRAPVRGPWMGPEGPGNFGPRFNGMGPPPFNRPPFERPPFDGPPRFNRMPFDGPRPPFDGPPFDGPFDGPRPGFDGPPFEGDMPFDGPPRFDGPPEFFDRNNRRFDDREQQFGDRGWNGDRGRGEWDDRRRDRRSDRSEDRYSRERGDRGDRGRRNFDDRKDSRGRDGSREADKPPKDDKDKPMDIAKEAKEPAKEEEKERRKERRERDRKSRWGAPEDVVVQQEPQLTEDSSTQDTAKEVSEVQSESMDTGIEPENVMTESTINEKEMAAIDTEIEKESKSVSSGSLNENKFGEDSQENTQSSAPSGPPSNIKDDSDKTDDRGDDNTVDTSTSEGNYADAEKETSTETGNERENYSREDSQDSLMSSKVPSVEPKEIETPVDTLMSVVSSEPDSTRDDIEPVDTGYSDSKAAEKDSPTESSIDDKEQSVEGYGSDIFTEDKSQDSTEEETRESLDTA